MGINYALLRSLTAREIISALARDGFGWDGGSGSHQIYRHSDWPTSFGHVSRAGRYLPAEDAEEYDREGGSLDGGRSEAP